MIKNFKLGDIVMVDLPNDEDYIQGKPRPCIVLGNELALRHSPIVTIIPLTGHSTKRMDIPCHVIVGPDETSNGLSVNSVVLCEQIRTVPKEWVFAYKGRLTPQAMELVLTAMNRQLVG